MSGKFLAPAQCIREGYLTYAEVQDLQKISKKYNTTFYVVGSRSKGSGRNIGRIHLPVGKGQQARSDIDVRIDGQKDIDTGGRLSHEISNVSSGAGNPRPLIGFEATPPAIIFKP